MNNLLFAVIILLILYYFYYYLPQQKKTISPDPKPLTKEAQTQTESIISEVGPSAQPEPEELKQLKTKHQDLVSFSQNFLKVVGYKSYEELQKGVKELKAKIKELEKQPLIVKKTLSTQTDPESDLENTLDVLLKGIQDLNKELDDK